MATTCCLLQKVDLHFHFEFRIRQHYYNEINFFLKSQNNYKIIMLFQKLFHVFVIHIGIRWCWLVCLSRAFPVINRVGGIPENSPFIYSQCTSVGMLAQSSIQRDPEHIFVYCSVCKKSIYTFLDWNRLEFKNINTLKSSLSDFSVPVPVMGFLNCFWNRNLAGKQFYRWYGNPINVKKF
jgi:hypothetical protein